MAGKKNAKKPNAKKLQKVWKLKAVEPLFKAACMRHGVPLYKPILEQIEQHVTDMKALNKICLQGADISEKFVRVLMECMAGYPEITTLCFWGCYVGDEGLVAISELLCGTAHKHWQGSKLKQVELAHDKLGYPPENWQERYQSMVTGATGFVAPNPGLQMPSWVMGTAPTLSHPIPGKHRHTHSQESGNPAADDLTFNLRALRKFSLALGITGSTLMVLTLDHNHLGDAGMEILAAGLLRASALKSISLAHCGFGPNGALTFASTMIPLEEPLKPTGEPLRPKYEIINLQGNKVCAQGLMNLCEGVKQCTSLKFLNLAAIGMTEDNTQSVKEFAKCLALNTSIVEVDFGANQIGDRGCEHFIPLLNVAKHIKILRLTHRIDRSIATQIFEAIKLNSAPKKAAKKGSKGKA